MNLSKQEMEVVSEMTIELTKLRHSTCNHLAIENFSPKLLRKLMFIVTQSKKGMLNIEDL